MSHDIKQDPGELVDRKFAEAWRPDPGGKLIGEIVELSSRSGFDDQPYPILTIKGDDGTELAFHAFHTVAKNELARLRPQVGQRIAIRYDGQKEGADGRARYHAYRVATDHAPEFSWGAFGDSGDVGSDIPTDEPKLELTDDDIPF